MGSFTVLGLTAPQVFSTRRTTDFSTTSTSPVLVMSLSFNLLARSDLLILSQPSNVKGSGGNASFRFYLDGSLVRTFTAGTSDHAMPFTARALNVSAGAHTVELYANAASSTATAVMQQPIDLVVIAFPVT